MDSTIHSILAAQYVQERMAEATGARAGRKRDRRRRASIRNFRRDAPARRPLLTRRVRHAPLD
jgi:hypothetical protein